MFEPVEQPLTELAESAPQTTLMTTAPSSMQPMLATDAVFAAIGENGPIALAAGDAMALSNSPADVAAQPLIDVEMRAAYVAPGSDANGDTGHRDRDGKVTRQPLPALDIQFE